MKKAILHSDGGARGNPGPAGIGYVLTVAGQPVITHGEYIGETTNNQAEYRALKAGLERAIQEGVTHLDCFLDSELVVKQLHGAYRVKEANLQPRFAEIQALSKRFPEITFTHVLRTKNTQADSLVNKAIDTVVKASKKH
jgi:ribonuclease HI